MLPGLSLHAQLIRRAWGPARGTVGFLCPGQGVLDGGCIRQVRAGDLWGDLGLIRERLGVGADCIGGIVRDVEGLDGGRQVAEGRDSRRT